MAFDTNLVRPMVDSDQFDEALKGAQLLPVEYEIIDYIRFIGTFTQPILIKALKLDAKPPVLSVICGACRKIGIEMPEHFEEVRAWSKLISVDGVRWDGDLLCSTTFNIDGLRLTPEAGTAQFHNFAVHPELFHGFD